MQTILAIAWGNSFHNLRRTLAALGGVTFSILLVFVQLAFLDGARREVTLLYDYFDFDLALTSDRYQLMATAQPFDDIRLFQAKVDPAVSDTFSLNVAGGRWVYPDTEEDSSMLLIGLDDKPAFIRNPDLIQGLASLTDGRSVILDIYSHKDYGPRTVGSAGQVNGLNVTTTALFKLGLFFFAEGSAATNNANFAHFSSRGAHRVTLGLIKLVPGADPTAVAARLRGSLPDDVVVLTRAQLYAQEQGYFVSVKPIGIMFNSAVLVAFIVGLVILLQVLATELTNRLPEYATMKAQGFPPFFLYGIGITQNLIFIGLSFVPAWLISTGVFALVFAVSKLPMVMTWSLSLEVAALTALMGLGAGFVALGKLRKADPASLY